MDEILELLENPIDAPLLLLPDVPEDQILTTIPQRYDLYINNPKISLKYIAKQLQIGKKRLKLIFQTLKLEIKKRGGQRKPLNDEIIQKVLTTKTEFDVGYKRVKDSYFINDKNVSYNDIFKIFQSQYLFLFHREKSKETHDNEYVAEFVNQIWHTDLKYVKDSSRNSVFHRIY